MPDRKVRHAGEPPKILGIVVSPEIKEGQFRASRVAISYSINQAQSYCIKLLYPGIAKSARERCVFVQALDAQALESIRPVVVRRTGSGLRLVRSVIGRADPEKGVFTISVRPGAAVLVIEAADIPSTWPLLEWFLESARVGRINARRDRARFRRELEVSLREAEGRSVT